MGGALPHFDWEFSDTWQDPKGVEQLQQQGFGGFVGNCAMGLIFGRFYQRTGRTVPLIIAHTIMDAVTFVGYVLLAHKVSWLPT